MTVEPEAAEVEKQEQPEDEVEVEVEDKEKEDMEEQERVDALLQRKKLLEDLGVVDQIYQMLQGRLGGGGVLQDAHHQSKQAQQRQQQPKVRADCTYYSVFLFIVTFETMSCFSFISVGLFDTAEDEAATQHSDAPAGTSQKTPGNTNPVQIIQYFIEKCS